MEGVAIRKGVKVLRETMSCIKGVVVSVAMIWDLERAVTVCEELWKRLSKKLIEKGSVLKRYLSVQPERRLCTL